MCSNQVEIKLYMSVRSNTNIENGMPKWKSAQIEQLCWDVLISNLFFDIKKINLVEILFFSNNIMCTFHVISSICVTEPRFHKSYCLVGFQHLQMQTLIYQLLAVAASMGYPGYPGYPWISQIFQCFRIRRHIVTKSGDTLWILSSVVLYMIQCADLRTGVQLAGYP